MAEHFKIETHSLDPQTRKKQIRESWLGPPPPKSLEILCFFFPMFLPLFRESWLGPPPSKESGNIVVFVFLVFWFVFFCFSKVFNKCGVLPGNWHESQAKLSKCPWECSKTSVKTSQNIILNHGKTALPGAAILKTRPCEPGDGINDD